MISKERIVHIVESYPLPAECFLVEVSVTADNRITVEVDSFSGVSIDFCAELSRHIESNLDRNVEDYELEVGSAGLTAPFKVLKQYEKNVGKQVEVLTADGQKVSGVLTEVCAGHFTLEVEKKVKPEGAKRKITVKEPVSFSYAEVKSTKYIFRFK